MCMLDLAAVMIVNPAKIYPWMCLKPFGCGALGRDLAEGCLSWVVYGQVEVGLNDLEGFFQPKYSMILVWMMMMTLRIGRDIQEFFVLQFQILGVWLLCWKCDCWVVVVSQALWLALRFL